MWSCCPWASRCRHSLGSSTRHLVATAAGGLKALEGPRGRLALDLALHLKPKPWSQRRTDLGVGTWVARRSPNANRMQLEPVCCNLGQAGGRKGIRARTSALNRWQGRHGALVSAGKERQWYGPCLPVPLCTEKWKTCQPEQGCGEKVQNMLLPV